SRSQGRLRGFVALISFWGTHSPSGLAPPSGDFEDAAEADGVISVDATSVATEAGELDKHFRGAGDVTITEQNEVVMAFLKAGAPVRWCAPGIPFSWCLQRWRKRTADEGSDEV